jgi:hypothetical protein
MKPSIRLLATAISLFALSLLMSGCYTQLATTQDEDQNSYAARPERTRLSEPQDTTARDQEPYYDDYDQFHSRVGFGYYYPSSLYWDIQFSDPYSFGWPSYGWMSPYSNYYGYWNRWSYYGYGYGYYPYGYYSGYPYVVYSGNFGYSNPGGRTSHTRDAG